MAEHGMECTFIDIMILVVGGIFSGFCLDSSPVFGLVAHVQVKGFALGGTVGVGVVQEILYSHEDLFDGNGRAPAFFFIQNGQTNGPTGIDIGVKQGRHKSTLGRFARILLPPYHHYYSKRKPNQRNSHTHTHNMTVNSKQSCQHNIIRNPSVIIFMVQE
jgi:hypothetical protein